MATNRPFPRIATFACSFWVGLTTVRNLASTDCTMLHYAALRNPEGSPARA